MKKVLLLILDGFGEGKNYPGNAVTLAKTPTLDALKKNYPWTTLKASGEAVGIPAGTQGGSEVGHFTMGAGRVIFQTLETINRSIKDGSFFKKEALLEACRRVREANAEGKKAAAQTGLHLIGMISDQGVHSHLPHLFALLELAAQEKATPVYIHAILDGRDVPERSATKYLKMVQEKIAALKIDAKIASIVGRYYAMDRDSNWNRTQQAYDLYTLGKGVKETDPIVAVEHAYARGCATDYYVDPIILDEHGVIKDQDSAINWNFRTDRERQLTWAFMGEAELGFTPTKIVRPFFVCFGPYSGKAPVVFPTPIVKNNLGKVIEDAGLRQFRIAETEKYAHVTYFFNSQIETPFAHEDRLMIDSPKCPSYAEKPEMSARGITDALLPRLAEEKYALVVLNFANCDLVGHSGDLRASIKAVEVVDECLGRIIHEAHQHGYTVIITGDHGNAEHKIYEDSGEPCPSHTTNPVPFILVDDALKGTTLKEGGELKDIAPTILALMVINKPTEMTGGSLFA